MGLMKAGPRPHGVYTNADSHIVAIVDYAHNRMSLRPCSLRSNGTPAGWSPCSAVREKAWTAGGTWEISAAAPTWWC